MDEIARAELAELRSTAALAGLDMAKLGDNVQLILAGAVERARTGAQAPPPRASTPPPLPQDHATDPQNNAHAGQCPAPVPLNQRGDPSQNDTPVRSEEITPPVSPTKSEEYTSPPPKKPRVKLGETLLLNDTMTSMRDARKWMHENVEHDMVFQRGNSKKSAVFLCRSHEQCNAKVKIVQFKVRSLGRTSTLGCARARAGCPGTDLCPWSAGARPSGDQLGQVLQSTRAECAPEMILCEACRLPARMQASRVYMHASGVNRLGRAARVQIFVPSHCRSTAFGVQLGQVLQSTRSNVRPE